MSRSGCLQESIYTHIRQTNLKQARIDLASSAPTTEYASLVGSITSMTALDREVLTNGSFQLCVNDCFFGLIPEIFGRYLLLGTQHVITNLTLVHLILCWVEGRLIETARQFVF